jgi:DNA-nicking Smr family endonuclease
LIRIIDFCPAEKFSSEEKQKIFEEARAPVNHLLAELEHIRTSLKQEKSHKKEKLLTLKHKDLYNKWKLAMKNATKDIYERVNSRQLKSGVNSMNEFCVDFHGLYVYEAKEIFNEFILPLLDEAKKIMIITGRGKHCENGKSILKKSIQTYFTTINIRFENVGNNSGAIYIFSDHY